MERRASRTRLVVQLYAIVLVTIVTNFQLRASFADATDVDVEVDAVRDNDSGVAAALDEDEGEDSEDTNADEDEDYSDPNSIESDEETAKQGAYPSHVTQQKRKKVFVPVFVPEKEKKKMKIIAVEKGFFVQGGTQLFGKFKSLKHCMKSCAVDPTCFEGDFNPWLHKCYKHTNTTACGKQRSHPQYVHFSKVPCAVTDAPRGKVTLGASMANGIEVKGAENLQQCIKKCVNAGRGIVSSIDTTGQQFALQACFAIDYDFAGHKCYVFGANIVQWADMVLDTESNTLVYTQCSTQPVLGSAQGTFPNPTVVHITFCPLRAAPPRAR